MNWKRTAGLMCVCAMMVTLTGGARSVARGKESRVLRMGFVERAGRAELGARGIQIATDVLLLPGDHGAISGVAAEEIRDAEKLNVAWHRTFTDWKQVEPPRLGTILTYTDFVDWRVY
jgi:hypothetical protein